MQKVTLRSEELWSHQVRSLNGKRDRKEQQTMTAFSEIPLDALTVEQTFTTGKGAKQIPLTQDGEAVVWQPKEWLSTPWQPGAYNQPDATRVNLVFNATPATIESLRA